MQDGDAPIACGPGCTACCYQTVQATIPEAILIALRLADPADPRPLPRLEVDAPEHIELIE